MRKKASEKPVDALNDGLAGLPVGEFIEEFLTKPTFDADGVQVSAGINQHGQEMPDPVPMAPPVGYHAPPDIIDMIKRVVRDEQLRAKLDEEGIDTDEEADDFEVEDDPLDPLTPYERHFEPRPPPPEPPKVPPKSEPPPAPSQEVEEKAES